mgnify:CR=1 FL=1
MAPQTVEKGSAEALSDEYSIEQLKKMYDYYVKIILVTLSPATKLTWKEGIFKLCQEMLARRVRISSLTGRLCTSSVFRSRSSCT